jgi:hypothetical protein
VLGNHDFEAGCPEKVTEILTQAGVTILDQQACVIEGVGFAGVKGFIGGFGRAELDPFGESAIKAFVDESVNEARKLEHQLRTLRTERVMAILHYAPIPETIEGEPLEIFPFLGSSRLAQAVDRFDTVKAVVHGPRPPRPLLRRDPRWGAGLQCRAIRGESRARPPIRPAGDLTRSYPTSTVRAELVEALPFFFRSLKKETPSTGSGRTSGWKVSASARRQSGSCASCAWAVGACVVRGSSRAAVSIVSSAWRAAT